MAAAATSMRSTRRMCPTASAQSGCPFSSRRQPTHRQAAEKALVDAHGERFPPGRGPKPSRAAPGEGMVRLHPRKPRGSTSGTAQTAHPRLPSENALSIMTGVPSRVIETAGGRVMTEPGAGQDEAEPLPLVRRRYGERLTADELEASARAWRRWSTACGRFARSGSENASPPFPRFPDAPPARDAEPVFRPVRELADAVRERRVSPWARRDVPRAAGDAGPALQRRRHAHP